GGDNSSQSCSQSPLALPAGVPVLQLANFQIPLMRSVCGTGDVLAHATVPDDGVAVYVGAFLGDIRTQALLDACPNSQNITDGTSVETFADTDAQMTYAGVIVAGTAASSDDIATARQYLQSLGGSRVALSAAQVGPGPGYVVASSEAAGTSWRL